MRQLRSKMRQFRQEMRRLRLKCVNCVATLFCEGARRDRKVDEVRNTVERASYWSTPLQMLISSTFLLILHILLILLLILLISLLILLIVFTHFNFGVNSVNCVDTNVHAKKTLGKPGVGVERVSHLST